MEHVLNLIWLAVAGGLLGTALRGPRERRRIVAAVFVIAVLFPIISASDDLLTLGTGGSSWIGCLLAASVLVFALQLTEKVAAEDRRIPSHAPAPHSDPRSPPRR